MTMPKVRNLSTPPALAEDERGSLRVLEESWDKMSLSVFGIRCGGTRNQRVY